MRLSYWLPVVIVVILFATAAQAETYVAAAWADMHVAPAYVPPVEKDQIAPPWEPPVLPQLIDDPDCIDGQCTEPPKVAAKPKRVLQTYRYGFLGRKKGVRWVTVQPRQAKQASSSG